MAYNHVVVAVFDNYVDAERAVSELTQSSILKVDAGNIVLPETIRAASSPRTRRSKT